MVGILIGVLSLLLVVVLVAVLAAGGVRVDKFALNTTCFTVHLRIINIHFHSGGDEDPDPKPLQPAIFKTPPKGEFVENTCSLSNFLSNYTYTCYMQANI